MSRNYGFVRVAAAVPQIRLADCHYNAEQIKQQIDEAVDEGVQIVCFPELSITGYTCADLFFMQQLQADALAALEQICNHTRGKSIIAIVGAPLQSDNNLYNCAIVMTDGDVVGVVPKINLPNTAEFYEKRWFTSGRNCLPKIELWNDEVPFGRDLLFLTRDYSFGVELCEDLWSPLPPTKYIYTRNVRVMTVELSSDGGTDAYP